MCNLAIFSTNDAKLVRSILTCKNKRIKPTMIITNKPSPELMEIAEKFNIGYKCFDHRDYADRVAHEKDIVRFLKKENVRLIIFAHYMRLITKYFVDRYRNKIINIHPSLLPDFKGADGYKDAYDAGVNKSGCTIHYVDEGLDICL
jgi:phosphoribosylglycinamide formyltransferase-1